MLRSALDRNMRGIIVFCMYMWRRLRSDLIEKNGKCKRWLSCIMILLWLFFVVFLYLVQSIRRIAVMRLFGVVKNAHYKNAPHHISLLICISFELCIVYIVYYVYFYVIISMRYVLIMMWLFMMSIMRLIGWLKCEKISRFFTHTLRLRSSSIESKNAPNTTF